jgi:hypothetical protein
MPNFTQGTDLGDVLAHPAYNDTLAPPAGPYRITYNGLRRTSTGLSDNDETADTLRTHIEAYNFNLDQLLSSDNLTATAENLKIPYINAAGVITLDKLVVDSITVLDGKQSTGLVYGGSLEAMDGTVGLTGTSWDGGSY